MADLLKDKICLVTGGTRGIGKAIVERFISEGAHVVATGRTPADPPEWSIGYVEEGVLSFSYFDVANAASVKNALLQIKRECGTIDAVVNNAGVEFNELIGANDEQHMHVMFETNVYGTILVVQYASRVMRQRKTAGAIVNISSGVGLKGNPGQAVYSATKGAVISFTRSAAKELAAQGIRVNSVAPGLTRTCMLDKTDATFLEDRLNRIPLGRLATPQDIADACLFLVSDQSRFITGQILSVDGCEIM